MESIFYYITNQYVDFVFNYGTDTLKRVTETVCTCTRADTSKLVLTDHCCLI